MKSALALAGAIAIATPAHAQVTIYEDHPLTWQTPSSCRGSIYWPSTHQTEEFACMRVEVSTLPGESHNIRFHTESGKVVYISDTNTPAAIHHIGISGPGGTMIERAQGTCALIAPGTVTCEAMMSGIRFMHTASFIRDFPGLKAILK